MATESYIVLSVSAGIMKEEGREPMPYASVEVANTKGKDSSRDGRISYGSPVLKLNLVDEQTGKPNIPLAERLAKSGVYGQVVEFDGEFDIAKKRGVEQITFTIFDANFDYKPSQVAAKVS